MGGRTISKKTIYMPKNIDKSTFEHRDTDKDRQMHEPTPTKVFSLDLTFRMNTLNILYFHFHFSLLQLPLACKNAVMREDVMSW